VQVGPDCTWVKSSTLTPSKALPAWPQGLVEGRGRPLAAFAGFPDFSLTIFRAAALDVGFAFAFARLDFRAVMDPSPSLPLMPSRASIRFFDC